MNNIKISIVKEFGTILSKKEADIFYKLLVEKLKIAIKNNKLLIIDFDGASKYSDNFLENSFGTLCRSESFDSIEILGHLFLISSDPKLIKRIQQIIGDALGWPPFISLYCKIL